MKRRPAHDCPRPVGLGPLRVHCQRSLPRVRLTAAAPLGDVLRLVDTHASITQLTFDRRGQAIFRLSQRGVLS